ncbi:hypothetical protein L916_13186 [Phytophthora nicotianae]|uniref:DDE-1 domain-containing protein n=2 Tax=Phytophthora nicotianae TaxID=4792 RepID=W2IK80_PHYNI|nr:hypothetical protein L916_13186 [Phytophthora nicotianae]
MPANLVTYRGISLSRLGCEHIGLCACMIISSSIMQGRRNEKKSIQLQKDILKARKELTQADTDKMVAKLREKNPEEKFQLEPPSRRIIVDWVSQCWADLSKQTIISGFDKVGILKDTRPAVEDTNLEQIENRIVEELENCDPAKDNVASDNDRFWRRD